MAFYYLAYSHCHHCCDCSRVSEAASHAGKSNHQEYVRVIDDNREALIRRLQIIESAEDELFLSTYYLGDDNVGRDVMSALLAASQRGVHIRLLVDGLCDFTSNISKKDTFQALLAQPNVEARLYNPITLLTPWNENYRMHDKYLAADDTVYILGGRNTANKSMGEYPGKKDADRDAMVYSPCPDGSILQLREYFEAVWSGKDSREVREKRQNPQMEQTLLARYEDLKTEYPEAFEKPDFISMMTPVNSVSLLVNPIATENKSPLLWTQLLALMGEGTDIEIQTPYIIISRRMHEELSALAQGRDIRIITNAPESGANPMGCADLLNRKKHLLKTGFRLYEYAGDRSAHVKTLVIDDHISIIGSFNFDMRSTYLNTETVLLIDSPEINAQLRNTNKSYMASSRCSEQGHPVTLGESFQAPKMSAAKTVLYAILRAIIVPLRQVL